MVMNATVEFIPSFLRISEQEWGKAVDGLF